MAGTTYILRMVPLVFIKRKIKNRFIVSFLHYIPSSVLTVMTVPAIFNSTETFPATVGFAFAVILAYFDKSLITVAASASIAVILIQSIINFI